jgi:hypothetical protein
MEFFGLEREPQRDTIWRLYQEKDPSLTLQPNEGYRKLNDLKDIYQRFLINKKKTDFWLCDKCEDRQKIVYANAGSVKSILQQHCKHNHKDKIKMKNTSIQEHFKTTQVTKPSASKTNAWLTSANMYMTKKNISYEGMESDLLKTLLADTAGILKLYTMTPNYLIRTFWR